MALQNILDQVTWLLARPDLSERIEYITALATQEAHRMGFFFRDVKSYRFEDLEAAGYLTWEDPANKVVANVTIVNPLFQDLEDGCVFRGVESILQYSNLNYTGLCGYEFKDKATDPLIDDFKRQWANYYLRLGQNLKINFGTPVVAAELQVFTTSAMPLTGDIGYLENDWLVQDYENLIIQITTAKLAEMVGQPDLAQMSKQNVVVEMDRLLTSETTVR